MPELSSQDRLQPALLDRLTDTEPGHRQETRAHRTLTRAQLRASVRRDLAWLLNSTRMKDGIDAGRYPLAAGSVLNFGLPCLTGQALSGLRPEQLALDIADVIRRFEPRILSDTLHVTPLPRDQARFQPGLPFLIEGDLWTQPYPEHLFYRAELDLEEGVFHLGESLSHPV
jgi:type VI secretion system protein ImpF